MSSVWTFAEFCGARGIIASVRRYRPSPQRAGYFFHQSQLQADDKQWRLFLRYRGRFAACCLYDSCRVRIGPVDFLERLFLDYWHRHTYRSEPIRDDCEVLRRERAAECLKRFLGPDDFYLLMNVCEEGRLR